MFLVTLPILNSHVTMLAIWIRVYSKYKFKDSYTDDFNTIRTKQIEIK